MEKERKKKKIEDEEYYHDHTLTEYIVKERIEEIGECAFACCENLETISFSRGIRKIGGSAFLKCRRVQDVTLKEGVEEIDDWAFNSCLGLKNVALVKGIRRIGHYAFRYTAITHFEMNEGLEEIGEGIFAGCQNLKTISFPLHEIKEIDSHALRSDFFGPPLPLKTLILRMTYGLVPWIPFPRITEKDDGQLVRFIEAQRQKYVHSEILLATTIFFTCFSLTCTQNGLYNAHGSCVLARIFRFSFRGASRSFPIREAAIIHRLAHEHTGIGSAQ